MADDDAQRDAERHGAWLADTLTRHHAAKPSDALARLLARGPVSEDERLDPEIGTLSEAERAVIQAVRDSTSAKH